MKQVAKQEHIQVNVSIIVESLEDGTFAAYPEYAEHIRHVSDEKGIAVAKVLEATAFYMDELWA